MKKVGHTSEFLFGIYWWTWKTNNYLKNCWSGSIKNKIILKTKKNTCRYHYQNLNDMIYSSWHIEQNILQLVILGHFLPFHPLKTPKIKILKMKKFAGDIIILHVYQKSQSYGSWDTEWHRHNFLSFWAIFCPFTITPPTLNDPKNQNFEKKWKKTPGDTILLYIQLYHKWKSYDIWFLKYKMRQT